MKKLILFLLFGTVVSGSAQNTQIYRSSTNYNWENGAWAEEYRVTNTVDKNGFLINYLAEEWLTNATGWQPQRQNTYTNNAAGLEIQRAHHYWNGGINTWVMSSVVQTTYNSNNKIASQLSQYVSSGTLTNSYKNTYFYNTKGQLILEEFMSWQSRAWELTSSYSYTNNSDGFPIQTLFESLSNGAMTKQSLTSVTYFAPGKISESVSKTWTTSAWVNNYKYTQGYDMFGFLVSVEGYEWNNNTWIQTDRYTVTNLDDGRMDFYIRESFNGSTWENSGKTVFDWSSALPNGIADLEKSELEQPAIYFDFNGRQVEKQKNVLLIEQRGNVKRKVIIQE